MIRFGRREPGAATGLLLALAAGIGALISAAPARAQSGALGSLTVDQVRLTPDGRHQVWVSALDSQGRPVEGLEASGFALEEDGRQIPEPRITPWAQHYSALDLTLMVDAVLLKEGDRTPLEDVLDRISNALGERDRLRVVAMGGSGALESRGRAARDLAGRLDRLAGRGERPRLFDALFDESRRAASHGGGAAAALLVITHGDDGGSSRGGIDITTLAHARGRRIPVLVAVLEDNGASPQGDALNGIAARTGGAVEHVASLPGLGGAVDRLLPRARGAYLLEFRAPAWDARAESHSLRIAVNQSGSTRTLLHDFQTDEALVPPWWSQPALWLWVGASVVVLVLVMMLFRRRRLFVLVIDAGPEQDCWFEVFAAPLTLGAAEGNDLTFDDARVSRNHAVLERRGRGIEIVDLNSENGTFVNGERVSRRVLAIDDKISLGRAVVLRYGG